VVDGPIPLPLQPKYFEVPTDGKPTVMDWEGPAADAIRNHDTVGTRTVANQWGESSEDEETSEDDEEEVGNRDEVAGTLSEAVEATEKKVTSGKYYVEAHLSEAVEATEKKAAKKGKKKGTTGKPAPKLGAPNDLETGGGPTTMYAYYYNGVPHNLEPMHNEWDKQGNILHKACDGQTNWMGYQLRHMDYADNRSKYGKIYYTYHEAINQFEHFKATGHPWRNYVLSQEDCPKGYVAVAAPDLPLHEGDDFLSKGVAIAERPPPEEQAMRGQAFFAGESPSNLHKLRSYKKSDEKTFFGESFTSPSTATGLRGVVSRKSGPAEDLALLEGPKKEARIGPGRGLTTPYPHKHSKTGQTVTGARPHFARQMNENTGGDLPFRPPTYKLEREPPKDVFLKEVYVHKGAFDNDRDNWARDKAARAN